MKETMTQLTAVERQKRKSVFFYWKLKTTFHTKYTINELWQKRKSMQFSVYLHCSRWEDSSYSAWCCSLPSGGRAIVLCSVVSWRFLYFSQTSSVPGCPLSKRWVNRKELAKVDRSLNEGEGVILMNLLGVQMKALHDCGCWERRQSTTVAAPPIRWRLSQSLLGGRRGRSWRRGSLVLRVALWLS